MAGDKQVSKRKRYNTVAAMVNDLCGPRSKFARDFRMRLKKDRKRKQFEIRYGSSNDEEVSDG